jgi:glycosyltransferase involved in cell wall biosynthesis
MKLPPFISVVTPSFNQASFIGEALDSVRGQNYSNYEHLVIDGMSTDGTMDMLRDLSVSGMNTKVKWISECDAGQSEALNKGFRLAKGDIIGWLNSDDRYRSGCFERVAQAFEENPDVDIFYGDYTMMDKTGKLLKIRREIEFNRFILLYHRVLYIPTTATFFRRKIFEEGNWLEEELHYAMDFEFFVRLAAKGYHFRHLKTILADFRLQPDSKSSRAPDIQRMEQRRAVLAISPILHKINSKRLQSYAMLLLGSVAAARRYSERLLRGHYWSQFLPGIFKP